MKYILSAIGVVVVVLAIVFCGGQKAEASDEYMRIHIVANSNSTYDQNVKYVVKDAVVEFLLPLLADADDKESAQKIISENVNKISEVANVALKSEGATYSAHVILTSEDMPTRAYGDLLLEEGIYDCLRIELGTANGDNWWCVVFPAVCFIDSKNSQNFEYISKIWDMISNVTKR